MVDEQINNNDSMQPPRLLIHLGAGKTGTSSVQQTLNRNRVKLKKQGIEYLGLMLENVEKKLYDWQNASDIEIFHSLPEETRNEAVLNIFRQIIGNAKKNIHTLIWSNESFFNRWENLSSLFSQLEKEGLDLEFIVYVRKHDTWSRSAYVQWGLKHKIDKGKIRDFNTWIKKRKPNFFPTLEKILDDFPNKLQVHNMDAVKDVVKDFLYFCKIDTKDFELVRSNDSPKNEELFLRTLFNSHFNRQVLPNEFDQVVSNKLNFKITPSEYLHSLLPTEEGLKHVRMETLEDKTLLNELLVKQNQEIIEEKEFIPKSTNVDSEILLLSLSEIILEQAKRIEKITKILHDNNIKVN